MPTVAICIPTIPKRHDRLAEAIASVVAQTRYPDEIHVAVDFGDRSADLGDGSSPTRNRALFAASTDYVAFLDDDDVMLPDHLDLLVTAAERTGADLVYPWFTAPGASGKLADDIDDLTRKVYGKPFGPDIEKLLRHSNHIPVTTLVRRSMAVKVGGFPPLAEAPVHPFPPHQRLEDWGFLLRLLDAGAVFHHVPEITWEWRQWEGNTTSQYQPSPSDAG